MTCPTRSRPAIAAFTFVALLVALVHLAPTGFARTAWAEDPPLPELALWQSQMTTYAQTHCTNLAAIRDDVPIDPRLGATYYDMDRVMQQIEAYTGDPSWYTCAATARYVYRDRYVLPATGYPGDPGGTEGGHVPGYWNFTTGLRMDYERTGNTTSQNAVIMLAENAAYASDLSPISDTVSADLSRETAYAIVSYIDEEKVGHTPRARRRALVDNAYGHFSQWFGVFYWRNPDGTVVQNPDGSYVQFSPFMVGLSAHALIRDWEQTKDPRLIPTLILAADWLWANAWSAANRSMWYEAASPTAWSPDLNLLIAPMYAFLYWQTGDAKYRDEGDALFSGGVDLAWLDGAKQFNQNYWWSFDYVKWRSSATRAAAVDTTPPSISITSPAASATVSGTVNIAVSATDNVGVSTLRYYLDGALIGVVSPRNPTFAWDSTSTTDGTHTLTVTVADAAGNTAQAAVSFAVSNADLLYFHHQGLHMTRPPGAR